MKENEKNGTEISNVLCINCGGVLKEAWNYCPNCKGRVETRKCPQCDTEISSQWKFCPYCQKWVNEDNTGQKAFNDTNEWLRAVLKISK